MCKEFKTVCGAAVELIHRDESADHAGGIVYGKIVSKSLFVYGFWDKNGMTISIPGLANNSLLLKFFNLTGFSEEDFLSIPMSDDEEI